MWNNAFFMLYNITNQFLLTIKLKIMKKLFSIFAGVLFASSMMAADLLNIDFTAGQGDWTIDNKDLGGIEHVWAQDSKYGMKASAYVDQANHATESWLVSPAVDLSAATSATLAFSHARRYGDLSQLSVQAKAGEGAWTVLEVSVWPDGTSWNFEDATADLSAFAGKANVQVAFVYTSSASAAATWEIKTVTITDGDAPVVPVDDSDVTFLPADFEGQGQAATLETPGGAVSATKNGVTVATDNGFGHNLALRVYAGGHFSITSTTEQIGKIKFQFYSTYDGGMDEEVVVNGMSFDVSSMAKQARIEKIQIYFGEAQKIELEPITVAEALDIAKALNPEKGKSATTAEKYAVKGYVVGISATKENTFYLADEVDVRGDFQAYQCSSIDREVSEGDLVIVTGKIQHYYGEGDKGEYHNYEIANGALVHAEVDGVENIALGVEAQKVMMEGVVYIVRDNKLFNLQGVQIR